MHSILRRAGSRWPRLQSALPARRIPRTFAILAVLAILAFVWFARDGFDPSSSAGWGFGIAAAVALLVVMMYSMRRSVPSVRRLGPTRPYMELHLYGGMLFLLLMLMHTGFGLPSGVLTTTLWVVALWVVASGLLGLALQTWIPRLIQSETSLEAHLERLPELVEDVRARAEQAARDAGPRVESFYDRYLSAEMARPQKGMGVLLARGRSLRRRRDEFDHLRRLAEPETVPAVDELRQLHQTKLDLDLHNVVQRALRFWLYLHLPVSIVLLVLFVLHVFFILYF